MRSAAPKSELCLFRAAVPRVNGVQMILFDFWIEFADSSWLAHHNEILRNSGVMFGICKYL